jgi:molybdopterin synthase catalytic subunit
VIRISGAPFDPAAELQSFMASAGGGGAVVSFVGSVRADAAGGAVEALELRHYPVFTEKSVAAIAEDARRRFDIADLLIIHRYGRMEPGEPIVLVATASVHRRAAFEAADYLMDRLKTEAPFWKLEHRDSGREWIEPRASDIADRARWGDEDDARN